MTDADVIIIGAGPAGSTTARIVAEHGYDVLIIDKNNTAGERTICGGGVNIVALEKAGLQLPSWVEAGRVVGSLWHFPWSLHEWRYKRSDYVSVHRRVFDNYLAGQAVERGARIQRRTIAERVQYGDGDIQVAARVLDDNNEIRRFSSKILIFADGPVTLARKMRPSAGFSCDPKVTAHGAIYEIEYKDHGFDHLEFHFDPRISPWGYGWIFPKDNILNVGVTCLLKNAKLNIKDYLDYFVNSHPATANRLHGGSVKFFGADIIPLTPSQHIHGERFAVVGDAAGSVNSFTGEGIKPAMMQATVLGKVLKDALESNDFTADFLSTYPMKWFESEDYKELHDASRLSEITYHFSKLDPYAYHKMVQLHLFGGSGMRSVGRGVLTALYPYPDKLRNIFA